MSKNKVEKQWNMTLNINLCPQNACLHVYMCTYTQRTCIDTHTKKITCELYIPLSNSNGNWWLFLPTESSRMLLNVMPKQSMQFFCLMMPHEKSSSTLRLRCKRSHIDAEVESSSHLQKWPQIGPSKLIHHLLPSHRRYLSGRGWKQGILKSLT